MDPSWDFRPIIHFRLGFSIINHPFWDTSIYGNLHIYIIMIIIMIIIIIVIIYIYSRCIQILIQMMFPLMISHDGDFSIAGHVRSQTEFPGTRDAMNS